MLLKNLKLPHFRIYLKNKSSLRVKILYHFNNIIFICEIT